MPAPHRLSLRSIGVLAVALSAFATGCPAPQPVRPTPPPTPPPSDVDGDGVVDRQDACPDAPEDPDGHDDGDGCPDPDNDGDRLDDADDACPDVAGVLIAAGCAPPDRDGDTALDHHDVCPDAAGPLAEQGCPQPTTLRLNPSRIELGQPVDFEYGKGVIRRRAYPALDALVALLQAHPQLDVEIRNHRDGAQREQYGMRITDRRAKAVMRYLVDHGVDPRRLVARGYGADMPIDTNATPEGRARNRRTEFVITRHRVGRAGGLVLTLRDLEVSPAAGPGNRDGDGLADPHDHCPDVAGALADGGCASR